MSLKLINKEQITPQELNTLYEDKDIHLFVIDVRGPAEYNSYHLPNAIHFPIIKETFSLENLLKEINHSNLLASNKPVVIVTYCNAGGRGGRSFSIFKDENENSGNKVVVKNLQHGANAWIDAGYKLDK